MTLPYFQVDTRNEHLKTLAGKHGSLWNEFNQKVDFSWIFHDHGLEGVVLQYSEISVALNNKLSPDQPYMLLYQEIRNLHETIQMLRDYAFGKREKERYTKTILQACYDTLVRDLRGIPEGDGLRQEDGRYGAYYHKCCPFGEIEIHLKKLFNDINQTSVEEVHPLVSGARLHYRLMKLMPYGRYSGKVTRLFTNLWLMRHNFPPAIIHTVERARYYEALAMDDESGLLELMRDAVNASVEGGLAFIEEGIVERRRKREARKARKVKKEEAKKKKAAAAKDAEDAEKKKNKKANSSKAHASTKAPKEKKTSKTTKASKKTSKTKTNSAKPKAAKTKAAKAKSPKTSKTTSNSSKTKAAARSKSKAKGVNARRKA